MSAPVYIDLGAARTRKSSFPGLAARKTLAKREDEDIIARYVDAEVSRAEGGAASSPEHERTADRLKLLPEGHKYRGGYLMPIATETEAREHNACNFVNTRYRSFLPENVAITDSAQVEAARAALARVSSFRAGLDSLTATKGLELKFPVPGSFLSILRANLVCYQAGMNFLTGLRGPIYFPEQASAGTAVWYNPTENPGSDIAASNLTLSQVQLVPKSLGSYTSYSRQLLAQAMLDVDMLVKEDLARILAVEIDRAVLYGSGAAGQPTGIGLTAGVTVNALGVNGATPTFANMVDMETPVAVANADQFPLAYFVHPTTRGTLKKAAPLSNTITTPAWSKPGAQALTDQNQAGVNASRIAGELNGYPAWATTNLPNNLTKGTSSGICLAILFGAPGTVVIGDWGVAEIIMDPYKLKAQGMIELAIFTMIGSCVKYPLAWTVIKDALA